MLFIPLPMFVLLSHRLILKRASLVAQTVKNLPAMQETWVQSLDWEDPLEKGMVTHSSIPAWRVHGQIMGSQRVGHDSATNMNTNLKDDAEKMAGIFFCWFNLYLNNVLKQSLPLPRVIAVNKCSFVLGCLHFICIPVNFASLLPVCLKSTLSSLCRKSPAYTSIIPFLAGSQVEV